MLAKFKKCLELEEKYIHIENDASYYIERIGDKLEIYFEWSNGKTDWMNNFDFPARPYRDMKDSWRCHRGFLKVWKSIEPYVEEHIFDLGINKVEIVGYSHGGAIAQLCYEYVRFHRPDIDVRGWGFGAPRVVWGRVGSTVRGRFEGFVTVINANDIVTKLPPKWLGYRHIGSTLQIDLGSKGPIDDHRPENYLEMLEQVG